MNDPYLDVSPMLAALRIAEGAFYYRPIELGLNHFRRTKDSLSKLGVEYEAFRKCGSLCIVKRGEPYGPDSWCAHHPKPEGPFGAPGPEGMLP